MTITLYPAGGASGALCPWDGTTGNATLQSPSGLDSSLTRQVQPSPTFRGSYQTPFRRGNTLATFSFSVFREHGSTIAAALFQLTHPSDARLDLPSLSYMKFTEGANNMYAINAIIQTISVQLKGRTTTTTYTIVCSYVTASAPA